MIYRTFRQMGLKIYGNIRVIVLIFTLLVVFILFTATSVFGQSEIGVNLLNYPHAPSTLTPSIEVAPVQFVPANVTILVDGTDIKSLPGGWLDSIHGPGDSGMYIIDLFVPAGKCVPMPSDAGSCVAPASCSGVAGFGTATRRKCYRIDVTAFGTPSTHTLCVYGPETLDIAVTSPVLGRNGQTTEIPFSINRFEEHYTWNLVESLPPYFSFTDKTGKDAKLIFQAPDTELAEQTFHMRVVNDLQPCDEKTVEFKVSSKGDEVFTGGPVDIVLVVDVSGSMGLRARCDCEGTPGCPDPPGKTKLRYLKEQIIQLHAQMKTLARPNDRIGLVSFHTTSKIEKPLVPFSDNSLLSVIEGWDDDGYNMTAMGSGLIDGVSLLTDTSRKRYIILMTNGMQNESPMVEWTDGSKNFVKVGSTVFNEDLGISVIPIAIFSPTGEYRNLLKALGKGTGVSVIKDVCESNASLLDAYTAAAKSLGSPKLVTFKRGQFAGGVAIGTFNIDEDMDRVLVNIINVGNQNFNSFKVEKNISNNWVDITALGSIVPAMAQTSIKRLFTMNFPATLNGSPVNSSGQYRYTVNSTIANVPYEFSVIIDDLGVKHSSYVGDEYYQAGDPFRLAASVFYNGQAVTNSNAVVVVESPVGSFSSKFSKVKIPKKYMEVTKVALREGGKPGALGVPYVNSFRITHPALTAIGQDGDGMGNADKKYNVLKEEGMLSGVFEFRRDTIPLIHQSNGIYKAQFGSTSHVGLYPMHFIIKANVPGVGSITRTDEKGGYINFGKPVLSKSKFYLMWEEPLLLSMTPIDGAGNLLGPGHADQISVYLSKGGSSFPNDYLDGTYQIQLHGITDQEDPEIIIRIRKDVLFKGKLSDIRRKRGFFSITAGYDFPQGWMDSTYNPGFQAELKLGYRFWKKLGGQLHLGYYSFKEQGTSVDLNTIGGGLGVYYRLPITNNQGWNLIWEANGGYYKPGDLDGAFGLNAGIGLNAFLNYNMSLIMEGKYYRIMTSPDEMNFLGTSVGLKFHF